MRDLEFDEFLLPVEAALAAFRETEKAKSIEAAAKRAAAQARSGEAATERRPTRQTRMRSSKPMRPISEGRQGGHPHRSPTVRIRPSP